VSFNYNYTIQFRDTDAAGVVYFANIISICHTAYEASLIRSGIDLKQFVNNPEFAVPISHVSADFFRPLFCGDRVTIQLTTASINSCKFEIKYQILSTDNESNTSIEDRQLAVSATAITRHIVINPRTRKRQELPQALADWLVEWNR
jgi:1,4-dihydroxy-2-naphthoyl-CoA hydrolase